uniref:Uncharacterized protein n=1 Tax=Strigops habroptila TaxID=2489341 RepID=A0A672UQG6_STRHB
MGNKALSHDSVFIFESAPGNVAGDVLSQENIPGRVKTLQLYFYSHKRQPFSVSLTLVRIKAKH